MNVYNEENKKMKWTEVVGDTFSDETPWKPEREGEQLIGTYILKKEKVGQYHQNVYVIQEDNGDLRSVFSTTKLNQLFEKIDMNDYIRITYMGTNPKNNFKNFKIEYGVLE